MNQRTWWNLVILSALGTGWGQLVAAASADAQGVRQEVRVDHEQATAYVQGKRAEWQQVKSQLPSLRGQAQAAKDPTTRQQVHAQANTLRRQMCTVKVDLAQQGVVLAQRHVELAQARLARLTAHETQLDALCGCNTSGRLMEVAAAAR